MLELYRFTTAKHVESLLAGNLYMSSLGYFWNNGFEGQKDTFEGVVQMQDPKKSPLAKEVQEVLSSSVMIRADAFQYCNLLCFCRNFYNPRTGMRSTFDSCIREFGEYAIRITDPDSFFNRVHAKAEQQGDVCISGPVTYRKFDEVVEQTDCFDKLEQFYYQKEWRIAYLHKPERLKALARKRAKSNSSLGPYYEEPYMLHLGRLDDIAEIVETRTLFESPEKLFGTRVFTQENLLWKATDAAFSGWGDRSAFRNKVLSLNEGKCAPIFTIG